MISKVQARHVQKPAYIYVRQSSMAQVRQHQQSTERQYALQDKARELGWPETGIRILDGDLGISGAQSSGREDFKTLVADVSMGHVGAVMALEASRLARSNADWHRLIELCSLTNTLILDEDGCYDPSDFNDGLLLGLKATMSQAELHFLRARLQGGRLNKANKGELCSKLPVGLCYDEQRRIVLDPDEQVRDAVRLTFDLFRQFGSAYRVARHFIKEGLRFPKRIQGGVWDGKLVWGRPTYHRVVSILKNPFYAGAYVFGRLRSVKEITEEGHIITRSKRVPMSSWKVTIPEHHEAYISWDEFLANRAKLEANRTSGEQTLLSGAAREGLALLQGLLLCGTCGHRVRVRYKGYGGLYPMYECNRQLLEGGKSCLSVRTHLLDDVICQRVLEELRPAQLGLAVKALQELERRDEAVSRQWQMRVERAEYEAQLAQRRYEEVDPSNRLVAANLERQWNDALLKTEELRKQYTQFQKRHGRVVTPDQKAKALRLAEDLPRLWHAPTTQARDKKRMLRLLLKDITVEKAAPKVVILHVRWQGGACEDIDVNLLPSIADRVRYPSTVVERVRELAMSMRDEKIAAALDRGGKTSATGQRFTTSMVRWIRYHHQIPPVKPRRRGELTVQEVAEKLGIKRGIVYYWIGRGILQGRRVNRGSPYFIALDTSKESELRARLRKSSQANSTGESASQKQTVQGAL